MTTYRFCLAGLALGLLLCIHQHGQAGGKATELQGAWTVVSFEFRGTPDKDRIGIKVIFDGDKVTFKDKKKDESGPIVLDTSKKPKQIDFLKLGSDTDKSLGIYIVDGNMLKICFAKGGDKEKDRPTEFASKKDGSLVLMVLKREKK